MQNNYKLLLKSCVQVYTGLYWFYQTESYNSYRENNFQNGYLNKRINRTEEVDCLIKI